MPLTKLEKGRVLGLEAIVEALGNPVHIEGRPGASRHIHDGNLLLLIKGHGNIVESLNEGIARLAGIKAVVAAGQGLALLTADPLPNLPSNALVGINDEMLAYGFGRLVVNFQARGSVGDRASANESDKPPFLRKGGQGDISAIHRDIQPCLAVIPTEMLAKERTEIE